MDAHVLDKRNRKIIERIGLGNAFLSLCDFISEKELYEWQSVTADELNIELCAETQGDRTNELTC